MNKSAKEKIHSYIGWEKESAYEPWQFIGLLPLFDPPTCCSRHHWYAVDVSSHFMISYLHFSNIPMDLSTLLIGPSIAGLVVHDVVS